MLLKRFALKRLLFAAYFALMAVLSFMAPARACMPLTGDSWFTYAETMTTSEFPQGVSVYKDKPFYDYDEKIFGKAIFIKNDAATPLYILQYPKAYAPTLNVTNYKLVGGKAFFSRGVYDEASIVSGDVQWQPIGELNAFILDVPQANSFTEDQITMVYRDDRPADVTIPADQEFTIRAVYGETPLQLKGKIQYALNANYDAKMHYNDPCAQQLEGRTVAPAANKINGPKLAAFVAVFGILLVSALSLSGKIRIHR